MSDAHHEEEAPPEANQHIAAAEYHLERARGGSPFVHPGMFRLPTRDDLFQLRQECGISREEAAERIGYREESIRNVERGDAAPGREMIQRLLTLYTHEWPSSTAPPEVFDDVE